MELPSELSYMRQRSVDRVVLVDGLNETVAVMEGEVEACAALADEICERYEAPLIILGRIHELYQDFIDGAPANEQPQWRVIHEGVRKNMTWVEIEDLSSALGFID